jgi:hypothetical protein
MSERDTAIAELEHYPIEKLKMIANNSTELNKYLARGVDGDDIKAIIYTRTSKTPPSFTSSSSVSNNAIFPWDAFEKSIQDGNDNAFDGYLDDSAFSGTGKEGLTDVDVYKEGDENQDTPLHLAAKAGNVDLVKRLLTLDPNKAIVNAAGETAADVALTDEIYNLIVPPEGGRRRRKSRRSRLNVQRRRTQRNGRGRKHRKLRKLATRRR